MSWRRRLKRNPVPPLLASGDAAVVYFAERDLLARKVPPIERVWDLAPVRRVLARQCADGRWRGKRSRSPVFPPRQADLFETFKRLRDLVERYELRLPHPAVRNATEYLLSFQTEAGDIRGMLANQYAPYYTGEMLALMVRAGYGSDERIERGLQWLLTMRQDDGGWTIPLLTHHLSRAEQNRLTSTYAMPLEPDRTQPFSHNWTDMVLRAFAQHARHRRSRAARTAGRLLKSRFFRPDAYASYHDAGYWVRFLFWWPNLLTSLRILARLGFGASDPDIARGLAWFVRNQEEDGLWRLSYAPGSVVRRTPANLERRLWLGLAISRMLQAYWP